MTVWDQYPHNYRRSEVERITQAVCAGDSVSVVGLSGSGKSNLLGFIAHRVILQEGCPDFVLVDCNRLSSASPGDFLDLIHRSIVSSSNIARDNLESAPVSGELNKQLENVLDRILVDGNSLCLLLDRFDLLVEQKDYPVIASNLRSMRDLYKYHLSYVFATRKPLDGNTELAELVFGNTFWLGPLSNDDALWSAERDLIRIARSGNQIWSESTLDRLVELSWGYPSLLRAALEAYASGCDLNLKSLRSHPAVFKRVAEFWADDPGEEALLKSGLQGQPLLKTSRSILNSDRYLDTSNLTAKENLLLSFFQKNTGRVCEKDELVQAVWPEDVIFEKGVRDESLAQLIRRLRVKIEPDPSDPSYIQTVPGRGYIFKR